PVRREFHNPRLEDDQLVIDLADRQGAYLRIAVAKSGLLVYSMVLPLSDAEPQPRQPIIVDAAEVLAELAAMVAFGWEFYRSLTTLVLTFEWSLEDLSSLVRDNDTQRWTRPWTSRTLSCQPTVTRTVFPELSEFSHRSGVSRDKVSSTLGQVVTELFFPFEAE